MFGLGFSEIIMVLVVVLLVLGPKHLPGAARSLGKALAEFRRSVDDIKREINSPQIDPQPSAPQSTTQLPAPASSQTTSQSTPETQPAADFTKVEEKNCEEKNCEETQKLRDAENSRPSEH